MNKLLLLVLFCFPAVKTDTTYRAVDSGSSVQFKIKNFGFNVSGSFTGLDGKISFDPDHSADAVFDVSIDAGSINTGIDARDNHLRGESYFDVKKFPRISLQSTKISGDPKKNSFVFSGKLKIKNTTRDISFPFAAEQVSGGYLFKGSFKINRKDFDIGGTSTISNEVDIILSVVAKQ